MTRLVTLLSLVLALIGLTACTPNTAYEWDVHDMNRPQPTVVTPGQENHLPPSDAIVLFDGTDFSAWEASKAGQAIEWTLKDGYMEVAPRTSDIQTKQAFGSCQLHIEWMAPEVVKGQGQGRGNSGVFFMNQYEVQILDSYNNPTYADGQAAAIYGQKPPMVNASRAPGQWQTYDIIFRAPQFEGDKLVKPATVTVLHNGVLVQDHWEIQGITRHKQRPSYVPHAEKLPLRLQDHRDLVRFRNIWIRPLED